MMRIMRIIDSSRSGRAQLIVLVAILVVLAAAAGWYFLRPATEPDTEEGRAVAQAFLDQVRGGKAGEAWDSTTAEYKSAEGRESFLRSSKAAPVLQEPADFISAQQVTIQDQPRTEYLFRNPKSGATVRIVIGNEAGTWKVDRMLVQ